MEKIRKNINKDLNLSILVGITILVLLGTGIRFGDSMYSLRNIQSMAFQIPEFGFLALAMMLSNLIGGIDLLLLQMRIQ